MWNLRVQIVFNVTNSKTAAITRTALDAFSCSCNLQRNGPACWICFSQARLVTIICAVHAAAGQS